MEKTVLVVIPAEERHKEKLERAVKAAGLCMRHRRRQQKK